MTRFWHDVVERRERVAVKGSGHIKSQATTA